MLSLPDSFVPGFAPPPDMGATPCWFVFSGQRLLTLRGEAGGAETPALALPATARWPLAREPLRRVYMGRWDGRHCIAAEVEADSEPPAGGEFLGLRELWGVLGDGWVGLAGQGLQLVDWDRSHQFCGRCGGATERRASERARHCPACGHHHYPRLAPAMMVRICRGDEILLARAPRFPPGMYSVLAGFVDPGESLEQTVRREVMEEVGLQVTGLRYLASQSWPFPHSLMIAFAAEHAGGEIRIGDEEIEHAAWFRRDALPRIPPDISIARRLIDGYLRGDDR